MPYSTRCSNPQVMYGSIHYVVIFFHIFPDKAQNLDCQQTFIKLYLHLLGGIAFREPLSPPSFLILPISFYVYMCMYVYFMYVFVCVCVSDCVPCALVDVRGQLFGVVSFFFLHFYVSSGVMVGVPGIHSKHPYPPVPTQPSQSVACYEPHLASKLN